MIDVAPHRRELFRQSAFRIALNAASFLPGARHRMRRYLPDAEIVVEGRRFQISPRDNVTEYRLWAYRRPPEASSLAALRALCRGKRCLFFDIGANIGLFSIMLLPEMAAGSKGYAFEPSSTLLPRLRCNLLLNGLEERVEVVPFALASQAGTATLTVRGGNRGGGNLISARSGREQEEVQVRVATEFESDRTSYDEFIVKIDVEGYEDEALLPLIEAAPERRPDHILIEVDHERRWRRDLFGGLAAAGYLETGRFDGNALFARAPFRGAQT